MFSSICGMWVGTFIQGYNENSSSKGDECRSSPELCSKTPAKSENLRIVYRSPKYSVLLFL